MEKELKYDIRKLSPKEQEEVRKKIVREMQKRGDAEEVAEICECTVRHVNKTWKKWGEKGIEGIAAVKMGRPAGLCKKLTSEQEKEIKEILSTQTPREAGLAGHLWGRAGVSELVKRKYGVEMPLSTMGDYLSRWNFTYQRPKKKTTVKTQKQ